jgi:phosphoribosylcarboxyaminoimidazole (NCAIR) mutase
LGTSIFFELKGQGFMLLGQSGDFLPGQLLDLGVPVAQQLLAVLQLGLDLPVGTVSLHDRAQVGMLAAQFLESAAVFDRFRVAEQLFDFQKPLFDTVEFV